MATKKKPAAERRPVGRPSSYHADVPDQAAKLIALGAIDTDLADFFHVSEQTINAWKEKHPEFLEAIKAAKEQKDAKVERSLYERAMGYSHPAVKIMQYEGAVIEAPYTERYPPETAACIFWLKNRQPARWRDKVDHEIGSKPGDPMVRLLQEIAAGPGGGRLAPQAR